MNRTPLSRPSFFFGRRHRRAWLCRLRIRKVLYTRQV
jgi:hypothetical protein